MENLKIGDLIEGEIYYCNWQNDNKNPFIFKANNSDSCKAIRKINNNFLRESVVSSTRYSHERGDLRVAKPKEKHWLNCCIEKNEFVPYEKAIETFNQNLVGRWVKKIKSDMWDFLLKEGEYDEIIQENSNDYLLKTAKNYYKDVFPRFSDHFELMPVGWTPNQQNTQQYEIGRWYEYNPERNYAKLESFDIKNNKFYFSDRIFSNGEYADKKECIKKYQNNYWDLAKFNTNYLTDLSEIQQYLPEGHVDKQKPKQSYEYEIVHCQTKEEWDFVREKTTKVNSQEWEKAVRQYLEGIALVSNGSSWCGLNYFKQFNTLILSFNEWCNKFGHSPDFINKTQEIPEYVECIDYQHPTTNRAPYSIVGRIYKFLNMSGRHYRLNCNLKCDNYDTGSSLYEETYFFKPSTKEAYEAQFKVYPLTPEECFNNETIEIGDFVNWKNSGTFDKKDFLGYEVWKISKNNFWIIYDCKKEEYQNYPLNIQGLKIIKKAKNNTTHVNKKVDNSLPENKNLITTKEKSLAHLLGIKKQLPNKTKRTQLTIIKPKQLKLN